VLAATGAIGGSSLAYIGPGASFLAVWGHVFLALVRSRWHDPSHRCFGFPRKDEDHSDTTANEETSIVDSILWHALGMPLWCSIAQIGESKLAAHFEHEKRLSRGVILPRRVSVRPIVNTQPNPHSNPIGNLETSSLLEPDSSTVYGSYPDTNQDREVIGRMDSFSSVEVKIEMDKTAPMMVDFSIAICYIILGMVAMTFGLGSILVQKQ